MPGRPREEAWSTDFAFILETQPLAAKTKAVNKTRDQVFNLEHQRHPRIISHK